MLIHADDTGGRVGRREEKRRGDPWTGSNAEIFSLPFFCAQLLRFQKNDGGLEKKEKHLGKSEE